MDSSKSGSLNISKDVIFDNIQTYLNSLKCQPTNNKSHRLTHKTYDDKEICAMVDVLLEDKLTMGEKVKQFEKEFANYVNSKYAIMVNSGSSANLLAMATLCNFKFKNKLNSGDKIIIPAICWSTSVWPIIQMGLEPVFVDIKLETLNSDIDKIELLLENDSKIRGIVPVHIIGNCTNMEKLMQLKDKYDLIMMEDTCESLGSTYNKKYLGTFGECGTFSFYYSHHITTVEGGMVVTNDEEIYEILKCLRAHGWSREQKNYVNTPHNKFTFINLGYNLRPMEIQAAMGIVQLGKLNNQNNHRKNNYKKVVDLLAKKNTGKYKFIQTEPYCDCCWFVIALILDNKYDKNNVIEVLESKNIETRPIVTGNFARQPVFKELAININLDDYQNANIVHDYGFFIGLPAYEMSQEQIEWLVDSLLE